MNKPSILILACSFFMLIFIGCNGEKNAQTVDENVEPTNVVQSRSQVLKKTSDYNDMMKQTIELERQGKYSEAIILYEKVQSEEPNNEKALYGLAKAYQNTNNHDKAEVYYSQLTDKYPTVEWYFIEFYRFYLDRHNYAKALQQYVKYEDILKERAKSQGHCEYIPWEHSREKAKLYRLLGDYVNALKEYDYYIDCYENTPTEYSDCDTVGELDSDFEVIVKERDETRRLLTANGGYQLQ